MFVVAAALLFIYILFLVVVVKRFFRFLFLYPVWFAAVAVLVVVFLFVLLLCCGVGLGSAGVGRVGKMVGGPLGFVGFLGLSWFSFGGGLGGPALGKRGAMLLRCPTGLLHSQKAA